MEHLDIEKEIIVGEENARRAYELYQLLLYPSKIQIENYDHIIKPALGTPDTYEFNEDEINMLVSYFTPLDTKETEY